MTMRAWVHLAAASVLVVAPASSQLATVSGTSFDIDIGGRVAVIDRSSAKLKILSGTGTMLQEMGGTGWSQDQFDRPAGVWARNGIDIFVADEFNHRIQRFDRSLNFVSTLSTRESDNPDERFGYPRGVTVSRHGELYILDGENIRVLKINRVNQFERAFGGFDAGAGRLTHPRQIAVGPRDRIYVLDGTRVVVFDSFGNFIGLLPVADDAAPTALFADDNGILIAGRHSLLWFNGDEQVAGTTPVPETGNGASTILSCAYREKEAYLLTEHGMVTVSAPAGWQER
jgi:hypothetical protein